MEQNVSHTGTKQLTGLKYLLNNISHALLFETLDNEIVFVNQQFCELFQIPLDPELLIGADCSKSAETSKHFFQNPEAFVEGIRKIYAGKVAVLNEELVLANGRSIYRDYKPLLDDPEHKGHLWIYKNFNEVRSVLAQTQEQKFFYEQLLNNIPADIAIFDKEHKYLFLNKTAVQNDEIRQWMIGKDDFDFCRHTNRPSHLAVYRRGIFKEALDSAEMVEFEETNYTKEGKKVHNLRRYYPLLDKDGKVNQVIGYGVNITRIKEREENLMEREQALKDLVHSMDQVVVTLNMNGQIKYANPKWEELTGLQVHEYGSQKIGSFIRRGRDAFLRNLQAFIDEGKSDIPATYIYLNDHSGVQRVFSYYLANFSNYYTTEKRVAVFLNDITARLMVERKLKRIAAEERRINEMKSGFISLVSHELRTPLSVILASTELIEMLAAKRGGEDAAGTAKYTDRIIHQVDKMTQLMNEFLFLSKIESGKLSHSPVLLDVEELIRKLIKDLYTPWTDGRSLGFSVKGKPVKVMVDELMLTHVLSNLITNAFKYSEGRKAPALRLRFSKRSWSLLVVDNGIGIPENQHAKIFLPFVRGSNVGSVTGTGFGLMIVNLFVKKSKGKIQMKSCENRGSAFLVRFPK